MKTTGVSDIPKFGLLDFLGHPILYCFQNQRWYISFLQKLFLCFENIFLIFQLSRLQRVPRSHRETSQLSALHCHDDALWFWGDVSDGWSVDKPRSSLFGIEVLTDEKSTREVWLGFVILSLHIRLILSRSHWGSSWIWWTGAFYTGIVCLPEFERIICFLICWLHSKVVPRRSHRHPQGPDKALVMGTLEIFFKICFCQFLQGGPLPKELTFSTLTKVEHVIADDQLKTSAAKEKEW